MSALRTEEDRWFILPMQTPAWAEESRRTVLAGKPIGANRLVAVFDTADEAEAAVREHNDRLDENGAAPASLPVRLPSGVEILTLSELVCVGGEKISDLGMLVTAQVEAVRSIVLNDDGSVSLSAARWEAFKMATEKLDNAALAAFEAIENVAEAHAGGVR